MSEETEAGSAGKQPAKGYSGLRCANGVSGSGRGYSARAVVFRTLDIGVMPPKIHRGMPRARFSRMNQKFREEARIKRRPSAAVARIRHYPLIETTERHPGSAVVGAWQASQWRRPWDTCLATRCGPMLRRHRRPHLDAAPATVRLASNLPTNSEHLSRRVAVAIARAVHCR